MRPNIRTSLEKITTGHVVFEEDQVLTAGQLNSLSDYTDDQLRLSRVRLSGVGLAWGLNVRYASSPSWLVTVTPGMGVTTDGDILAFDAPAVFSHYKPYDRSYPAYPPLYANGDVEQEMVVAFELLPSKESDVRAQPLQTFDSTTGIALTAMTVVLLMESYEKDDDLCSGTDCDNLGKEVVHTQKVLLVRSDSAALLSRSINTPHDAGSKLPDLALERPLFASPPTGPTAMADPYRSVCTSIQLDLMRALEQLYTVCSSFITDVFPASPIELWRSHLTAYETTFSTATVGIQYYFTFLKDLIETYQEIREHLFEDTTWYANDPGRFPKHLVLGTLGPDVATSPSRTSFYPSPVVSKTSGALEQVKFLLSRLDLMIKGFSIPMTQNARQRIRITPGAFEDKPLDARALPYYYRVNKEIPLHQRWSYALHRRSLDTKVLSYHASDYATDPLVREPLKGQLGRYAFFRIEGHLGRNVEQAQNDIELQITANNLPFTVRAVYLGTDPVRIVKKPGIRYTDLNRFHYLLRQDAVHQLDDVSKFSTAFKGHVDRAVASGNVTDAPDEDAGASIRTIAADKDTEVRASASSLKGKLNVGYSSFRTDTSWRQNLSDTLRNVGEYKLNLSSVVKTEFPTPFDALIGSSTLHWIDWLDEMIRRKDKKEDEKLLFSNFLARNPGLEHFGGVSRGGTFVLVYDSENLVMADFMLPYFCPDLEEAEEDEPALERPPLRTDFLIGNGVKVLPSRTKFVQSKLSDFKVELKPDIDRTLQFQDRYVDLFKESINVMATAYSSPSRTTLDVSTDQYNDELLGSMARETDLKRQQKEILERRRVEDPGRYEQEVRQADAQLATSLERMATYMTRANTDVLPGTDGYKATMTASNSINSLSTAGRKQVSDSVTNLQTGALNPNLQLALNTAFKAKSGGR